MYKVLITPFIESIDNDEVFRILHQAGCELDVRYFQGSPMTEEEISGLIEEVDGVIASGEPYTKSVLDKDNIVPPFVGVGLQEAKKTIVSKKNPMISNLSFFIFSLFFRILKSMQQILSLLKR